MTNYRSLQLNEIDSLVKQGCSCDNWTNIQVKEEFRTDYIKNVQFSGQILLGLFSKSFSTTTGPLKHSGIYKACIHNCEIADNTYLSNIHNQISNYKIEENVYIENTASITCNQLSSFGNGTKVALINEAGGREIQIFDNLSAQLAYMVALYRHKTNFQKEIQIIIEKYISSISANYGTIGKNAKIINCGTINEVRIGAYASINGTSLLKNGSINSNKEAPVTVGQQVIARNFIFSSGSKITDAALVENSFIGQAAEISKQFSVYDSAFFCNTQGFHGEACSVFAGPYTASHHKSSLLIAGMFSFMNTGSGSNQSNHMYKLGPVHQGILERGSKTASDSYILWPAKIGAFTMVMGRHYNHPDTSNLPFSYLIENQGKSHLIPGINITSIGTLRDMEKWPKRDLRKDPNRLDNINFNQLSPYTLNKVYKGKEILRSLQNLNDKNKEYHFQGTEINTKALNHGISYYQMIIDIFIGDKLLEYLNKIKLNSATQIINPTAANTKIENEEWSDLSGLLCPSSSVDLLINTIESKGIKNINELNNSFLKLHTKFNDYQWEWVLNKLMSTSEKPKQLLRANDLIKIIQVWKNQSSCLLELRLKDASKEFAPTFRCSFGENGTAKDKDRDFNQVRGNLATNTYINSMQKNYLAKRAMANTIIEQLKQIP